MRLLFITPHLSTGGLPQFLLKKIEVLNDTFDIWCIEWDNITGGQLVVQRNQIQNLLGLDFVSQWGRNLEMCQVNPFSRALMRHYQQ